MFPSTREPSARVTPKSAANTRKKPRLANTDTTSARLIRPATGRDRSSSSRPRKKATYPGNSGSAHGAKNVAVPAPNAKPSRNDSRSTIRGRH